MLFSHLSSLSNEKRRERLEWLGDAVMEEVMVRLVAREALKVLENQPETKEPTVHDANFLENILPMIMHCGAALRTAVSNENLAVVYETKLAGLAEYIREESVGEDSRPRRKRRRSLGGRMGSSVLAATGPKLCRDKRLPDLVEAAIGEAFEASLKTPWTYTKAIPAPQSFNGCHRQVMVDQLLTSALRTKLFRDSYETCAKRQPHERSSFSNTFGALQNDDEDDDYTRQEGIDGGSVDVGHDHAITNGIGKIATAAGQAHERGAGDTAGLSEGRHPHASVDACEERIAAAREAVFRLYGAVLIRFRVSVFLFCSTGAAHGHARGRPSELTVRRQKAICAENLEAVATMLPQFLDDRIEAEERSATYVPSTPATRKNQLRSCVGRISLCQESYSEFSAEVASLLLARCGERDELMRDTKTRVDPHVAPSRAMKEGRNTNPAESSVTADEAHERSRISAEAAAVAESQFRRDSWPGMHLPEASAQAARLFQPAIADGCQMETPSNAFADSANEDVEVRESLRQRGKDDRISDGYGHGRRRHGKKRKRDSHDCSIENRKSCLPRHDVYWGDALPREDRHLLARLGHHGYVKVLEEILDKFRSTTVSACEPPVTRVEPRITVDHASHQSHLHLGHDDVWQALNLGQKHPSLCGLIEPAELALAEQERMVLPMPNPFYRRVLHALCKIHGLQSRGGQAGDGGEYRTVEVERRLICDSPHKRRTSKVVKVEVRQNLTPVEMLLGPAG